MRNYKKQISNNLLSIIIIALILLGIPQTIYSASDPIQITIHPEIKGYTIPSNFLGLSFSEDFITKSILFGVDPNNSNDQILLKLLKKLGQGVLRFGGTDTNYTYWLNAPPPNLCKTSTSFPTQILTKANVDNLFAFSKEVNWSVIFGLNFGCYNSTIKSMIVNEASYFKQIGNDLLLALEIGNEPTSFPELGLRPDTYNSTIHSQEFDNYAKAIHAVSPGIPLTGPAISSNQTWFKNFITLESSEISFATVHLYPVSKTKDLGIDINTRVCEENECLGYIEKMLSKEKAETTNNTISAYATIAKEKNIPLRFDEVNAMSRSGLVGVTDTFASTLWGIDTLFMMVNNSVAGVNFHGGGCGGYTPILFCPTLSGPNPKLYKPGALYYSMLFFHEATKGKPRPLQVEYDKNLANLGAYAVLSQDNILRIILVNRDSYNTTIASLDPGNIYPQARAIRLLAPSINASRENITFAGNSVKEDGSWTFGVDEPVTKVNSKYPVSLPPGSATLVVFSSTTSTPIPTQLPGDIDGNGKVDNLDYKIFIANFDKTGSPGFISSDIDKNGKVDIFDYNVLVENFN
ncbi:MAG: glycosyl hydrolase family protein [Candidatus Woesebacteria bacterium]|nr:glycosyl hydrolase family protein [Candidatus Woesebacteria bacterium]